MKGKKIFEARAACFIFFPCKSLCRTAMDDCEHLRLGHLFIADREAKAMDDCEHLRLGHLFIADTEAKAFMMDLQHNLLFRVEVRVFKINSNFIMLMSLFPDLT
ncbi:hypothetical protein KP509_17G019200 [Ceratopteris richardii]|uniref:Uncharacterized protein n=1 Tax=Ceratopteris richardii TaxID=49495 RepID=A0A8T2SUY4_CERRI|nr:hypothetical protein KP509_17G019200 [Ceratopteris richardii]